MIKFDDSHKKYVADAISIGMKPDVIKSMMQREFKELELVSERALFLFITQVGKSPKWKQYISSIRSNYVGDGRLNVDLMSPKSRLEICQKIVKDELDKGMDGDTDKIATFMKLGASDAERIAQTDGRVVTYEDFVNLIYDRVAEAKKALGKGAQVT